MSIQMPPEYSAKGLLQKHMDPLLQTNAMKRIRYDVGELMQLCADAEEIFKAESTLATVKPPVVVVGDIHGQFSDMLRIFDAFGVDGRPGFQNKSYVFLGDYVDRGRRSLECITLALVLKVLYPTKYTLLRGNHECQSINRAYGFYGELLERYKKKDADDLYVCYNQVFAYLPLAALIGKKILCMHGGFSSRLQSLDDIRNLQRPIVDPMTEEPTLAVDLLWADPMIGMRGFVPNAVRGLSVSFGEDTVTQLCHKLDVALIARGHQVMRNGYGFFCGRKLITIFSAPAYMPQIKNKGAVMVVDANGQMSIKVFLPREETVGERYFRDEFEQSSREETSYNSLIARSSAPGT